MQVTELENKALKRSFKVVVEASRIETQVEAELKQAGQNIKMPGFRPGFVPIKVLKQRYGKSVQADVLKNIISRVTGEVISEKKLKPALSPQIAIEKYEDGKDLTYTMSFEVLPEVPDVAFNTITLDRKTFEIEEKDIDEALNNIAERTPKLARAKEGSKAKLGQVAVIDFKGMIGGKAFDGGTATNFKLELGSKQFIDTFEEQLVGTQEGDDLIVKVTFPENYGSDELAGKEASFAVKVKEIHNKETPAIDDAFAKQCGMADLRALREAIRSQLIREYDQVVRRDLKKQLFDILEEKCDFTLPKTMVDMEFNIIWERLQAAKKQGDQSVAGKSDDELKEEYQRIADRRVKLGIFLAEIGQRNNVAVSNEELQRSLVQQASQFPGQEKQFIEFYRNHPERIDDLRGPILEEKSVDFILGKVKYNDEKVALSVLEGAGAEEETSEEKPKKKTAAKPKAKKKAAAE